MDQLIQKLHIAPGAHILDLPCGRGRHSLYLHNKGFRVTGADLSPHSIEDALQKAQPGLHFLVHDIREALDIPPVDYVFNLFTSFGYFDLDSDNLASMQTIAQALKPGGKVVIDFLNVPKVVNGLVPQEVKEVQGIVFKVKRWVENGLVHKQIDIDDHGKIWSFRERVRLLEEADFVRYFESAGLRLEQKWGNYALQGWDSSSDRLILQAIKTESI